MTSGRVTDEAWVAFLFRTVVAFPPAPFLRDFSNSHLSMRTALLCDILTGGRDRLLSLCPVQELPMFLDTTLILPVTNPLNSEHQMDKEESLLISKPRKPEQKIAFLGQTTLNS